MRRLDRSRRSPQHAQVRAGSTVQSRTGGVGLARCSRVAAEREIVAIVCPNESARWQGRWCSHTSMLRSRCAERCRSNQWRRDTASKWQSTRAFDLAYKITRPSDHHPPTAAAEAHGRASVNLVAEERTIRGSYLNCVPVRDIPRYVDLVPAADCRWTPDDSTLRH